MRAVAYIIAAFLWLLPAGRIAARSDVPALQQLADGLDLRLGKMLRHEGFTEPVIALSLGGDASILGREARILQELERLLVYRLDANLSLGRAVPLGVRHGAEAIEVARRAGATLLLSCVLGVDKETVHLAADLVPLKVPFWDWLVDPVPRGAREHLFVSTGIDREVRVLLGKSRTPGPLGAWRIKELVYLPGRIVDAGAGEIDGTPGGELALLFEDSVVLYSMRRGRLKRLATYELGRLPEAAIHTRDPAGSLLVADFNRDGQAEIFYQLFNNKRGEILSWTGAGLRSLRKLEKVPLCVFHRGKRPKVVYGSPEAGTNRYLPRVEIADINQSGGRAIDLPGPFVTLRCWQSADSGIPWIVFVDLNSRLSRLNLKGGAQELCENAGAGSTVVDLDRDDTPELVVSETVLPGEQDGVRIVADGNVVWQSRDVVGGILAVAGGEIDETGKVQALLIAVEKGGTGSRVYLLGK